MASPVRSQLSELCSLACASLDGLQWRRWTEPHEWSVRCDRLEPLCSRAGSLDDQPQPGRPQWCANASRKLPRQRSSAVRPETRVAGLGRAGPSARAIERDPSPQGEGAAQTSNGEVVRSESPDLRSRGPFSPRDRAWPEPTGRGGRPNLERGGRALWEPRPHPSVAPCSTPSRSSPSGGRDATNL